MPGLASHHVVNTADPPASTPGNWDERCASPPAHTRYFQFPGGNCDAPLS